MAVAAASVVDASYGVAGLADDVLVAEEDGNVAVEDEPRLMVVAVTEARNVQAKPDAGVVVEAAVGVT